MNQPHMFFQIRVCHDGSEMTLAHPFVCLDMVVSFLLWLALLIWSPKLIFFYNKGLFVIYSFWIVSTVPWRMSCVLEISRMRFSFSFIFIHIYFLHSYTSMNLVIFLISLIIVLFVNAWDIIFQYEDCGTYLCRFTRFLWVIS